MKRRKGSAPCADVTNEGIRENTAALVLIETREVEIKLVRLNLPTSCELVSSPQWRENSGEGSGKSTVPPE